MKKNVRKSDVFLSVIVCMIMAFVGMLCVGCKDKYQTMTLELSAKSITLRIEDGACEPVAVIATIEGDASISRRVEVNCESPQLQIDTQALDDNSTRINVSASGVCTNAVVEVLSAEGDKSASFLVSVVVPVQAIFASEYAQNFCVTKGTTIELTNALAAFEPAATTQTEVQFRLKDPNALHASIENNRLQVDDAFADDHIEVLVTSPYLQGVEVPLSITVLPRLDNSTISIAKISYNTGNPAANIQIYNKDAGEELPRQLMLSTTLAEKHSIMFELSVNSNLPVTITPKVMGVNGSLGISSDLLFFDQGQHIAVNGANGALVATTWLGTLSCEGTNGQTGSGQVLFEVKFNDFDIHFNTQPFVVNVQQSVKEIQLFANAELTNNTNFVVFDTYKNMQGLALTFLAQPANAPENEKVLLLQGSTNIDKYSVFDKNGNLLNFANNQEKVLVQSGDVIYVKANQADANAGELVVCVNDNPSVRKTLTFTASAGTQNMTFANAKTELHGEEEKFVYAIATNQPTTQSIEIGTDMLDTSSISVQIVGEGLELISQPTIIGDKIAFDVQTQRGAEGTATIIVKHENGFMITAEVKLIYELKKENIDFNVPSEQVNASVGEKIDANDKTKDWVFRVAVELNNSISLTRTGQGVSAVEYAFYDFLLPVDYNENETSKTEYDKFFDKNTQLAEPEIIYSATSQVLNTSFLNLSQIQPIAVGKTWVKVTLKGFKVEEVDGKNSSQAAETSFTVYFMVEGFVPVQNPRISQTEITLFSQDSVGYDDYAKTTQSVEIIMNDATYQNIEWLNDGTTQVGGKDVYVVQKNDGGKSLTITALGTWKDENGVVVRADSVSYDVGVQIQEFRTIYLLIVRVNIVRAVQVEKIVVENVNLKTGLYIPLDAAAQQQTRKIDASVQIGASGKVPQNTNLVFEFLAQTPIAPNLITVDRRTGLITIKQGATVGCHGKIRVAPADRYDQFNMFDQSAQDVAVIFDLVIADGQTRETAYRVSNMAEVKKYAAGKDMSKLHFVLRDNFDVVEEDLTDGFVFGTEFAGGIYGSLNSGEIPVVLKTCAPLAQTLRENAVVADLIVCGTIEGAGFIANTNFGKIENVEVAGIVQSGETAKVSVLTAANNESAIGGLVGVNAGQIIHCAFAGSISASNLTATGFAGGLVGQNSGVITQSKVEFCTYMAEGVAVRAEIDGGEGIVGGIVGNMAGGKIEKSFVKSYFAPSEVGVLSGSAKGVLIGKADGGEVDQTFGYLQEQSSMFGQGTPTILKNAYITYQSGEDLLGTFVANGNTIPYVGDTSVFNAITNLTIWDKSTALPTFVSVKAPVPMAVLPTEFASGLDNAVSNYYQEQNISVAILMYYNFDEMLTEQERAVLNQMNFIPFSALFNDTAVGIMAFSNAQNVVACTNNGIQIKGTGYAKLTFYSIYDASVRKTFDVFVILPVAQPTFVAGTLKFGNGNVIVAKATNNLHFSAYIYNQLVLDMRSLTFGVMDFDVQFEPDIADPNQRRIKQIGTEFSVIAQELTDGDNTLYYRVCANALNDQFAGQINELFGANETNFDDIFQDLFGFDIITSGTNKQVVGRLTGKITIKSYYGADKIQVSDSSAVIDPIDTLTLDVVLYTDKKIIIDEATGETTDKLIFKQLADEVFGAAVFDISSSLLSDQTQYFASSDMTEPATAENAKYFAYHYKITIGVNAAYRGMDFQQTIFHFVIESASAIYNTQHYDAQPVFATFDLTLNSQTILSISANHYDMDNKSIAFDETAQQNFVLYQPDRTAQNSVLAPGHEGMLQVDLYPTYACFDYVEVTYVVENAAHQDLSIMLSALKPWAVEGKQGYRQAVGTYSVLPNGIQIQRSYIAGQNTKTLYIGTYMPVSTNVDAVFVITICAYNNENQKIASTQFNLVAKYLEDAQILVTDNLGNPIKAAVRGETVNLYITLPKDQDHGLDILGCVTTITPPDPDKTITHIEVQEIQEPNSLTRTIKYVLHIGKNLEISNGKNHVTIQVKVTWKKDNVVYEKICTQHLAIVDFVINEISLLTDTPNKAEFFAYIGVESTLTFDFNGRRNQSTNEDESFKNFLKKYYFQAPNSSQASVSGNEYYIVGVGNQNATSFLGNLHYVTDGRYYGLLNPNGTYSANNYFEFKEQDGEIVIVGTRQGEVHLRFILTIQYPSVDGQRIVELPFDFTVIVEPFSDEDKPVVIDNAGAFVDALNAATPRDYILLSDITLENYTPLSTDSILSLDGNNCTINIASWNTQTAGSDLNLALFDNVAETTTLKNLIVNIGQNNIIADTNALTRLNVAGLAISNQGIIYNCAVVTKNGSGALNKAISVDYSAQQLPDTFTSTIAGFVINNSGYITNSRVGGKVQEMAGQGFQNLDVFEIVANGNISGFVDTNGGTISSSYFANGTLTNTALGSPNATTSGFARYNAGVITSSYAKGTGDYGVSMAGKGITTSGVGAGFIHTNAGQINDCYANILLATDSSFDDNLQSGRLSSGFAFKNLANIENCYSASKIENAKSTQTAFVGVDEFGNLQNFGKIASSYYYSATDIEGDEYSVQDANLSVVRIMDATEIDRFYGFSFADSASSVNGVWYSSAQGIDLVSANQVAVSKRYIANQKTDEITGEVLSYNLPYVEGYEYGSVKNPIIIRTAQEFNRVFGGDDRNAGSAISRYYNLSAREIYGNYRLVANIDLASLSPASGQSVGAQSALMQLSGAVFDGNMLTISGVQISAPTEEYVENFGLFAALKDNACIKNVGLQVVSVGAKQAKFVGTVAGVVTNSKLVNIVLSNQYQTIEAKIVGNNVVGGLVGLVQGQSQIKNIVAKDLSIKANTLNVNAELSYSRNFFESITVNRTVSYAGGIIGVADVFEEAEKTSNNHKTDAQVASITNLVASGRMNVRASTAGGVIGYVGPQTNVRDLTFEVGVGKLAKIVAYNLFAGGVIGENWGNIDMAKSQHAQSIQKEVENNVSNYYRNPSEEIERGHMSLFDDTSDGEIISTYQPIAVGGLVGNLKAGDFKHSYSKVNVINSKASYIGGLVGAITSIDDPTHQRNEILFYETYAFGDVKTQKEGFGAGGIVGFVQNERRISMVKVNAVNYWGLEYNEEEQKYFWPELDNVRVYQIYAMTGSNLQSASLLADITAHNHETGEVTVTHGYSLPVISTTGQPNDMYAITEIKWNNEENVKTSGFVKESIAAKTGGVPYNMVLDPFFGKQDAEKTSTDHNTTQAVTPYYELVDVNTNGNAMDTYFVQANWDTNYWVRYSASNDMLPSLVTFSSSMTYYIDKKEDLQNMLYHPYATFIVRGKDAPSTIIPVGQYIQDVRLVLNNFSGTLKGLDQSGNYGFDFEKRASFITATTGASFYNLTLKNLGYAVDGETSIISQAFIDTAVMTTFENILMTNCHNCTTANNTNFNIGILANKIQGGYLNGVYMENCSVEVLVASDQTATNAMSSLNVGIVAGELETKSNAVLQLADVCVYQTPNGSTPFSNNNNNNININLQNAQLDNQGNHPNTTINTGALIGKTSGNVSCSFSSQSAAGDYIKGIGIAENYANRYTQPLNNGTNRNGFGITLTGNGAKVANFNAGLLFGDVSSMTVSFNRTAKNQALQVVGYIEHSYMSAPEDIVITNAENVGGLIGYAESNVSIINNGGTYDKFMVVDANIKKLDANTVNAGMLVGKAKSIHQINNIATYGDIGAKASGTANVGGFVGVVHSGVTIVQSTSGTKIAATGNDANVGGLIGLFSATSGTLYIGAKQQDVLQETPFTTKVTGHLLADTTGQVNIGGILGATEISSGSALVSAVTANITKAVFSGTIEILSEQGTIKAGGIVGASKTSDSNNGVTTNLDTCLSLGEINVDDINCSNIDQTPSAQVYVGGLMGHANATTVLNENISLASLTCRTAVTQNNVFVNALVGNVENDVNISGTNNYYSHQISLCLDLNSQDFGQKNIYVKRTDSDLANNLNIGKSAILDLQAITDYIAGLTETELLQEYYLGSKLNPELINNPVDWSNKYANFAGGASRDATSKKLFVVITSDITISQSTASANAVNAHLMGDGRELTISNPLFGEIDENSSISGVRVVPNITNNPTATDCTLAVGTKSGIGAIANVNKGFVFATVVTIESVSNTNGLCGATSADAGGLVGINTGIIMDCMSAINVENANGFVGWNAGSIVNSYSVGVVTNGNAFGDGNGKVFGSYTASPVDGGTGVFGDQTLDDSFYDIYATGVKNNATSANMASTDKLAVLDSDSSDTCVFAEGSAARQKFGFDHTTNFGYPSFVGTPYQNLTYMKGPDTGEGTTVGDPIYINSAGKLQQINNANNKDLYYQLVRDITVTAHMIDAASTDTSDKFNKDFQVANWKPVAGFKQISGQNIDTADNRYTISNITYNPDNSPGSEWAIFGKLSGATICNLNIEYSSTLSVKTNSLAVLMTGNDPNSGSPDPITVENVNITAGTIKSTITSGEATIGVIAPTIQKLAMNNVHISVVKIEARDSDNSGANGATLGALVGQAADSGASLTLNAVSFEQQQINFYSLGAEITTIGGLIGNAEENDIALEMQQIVMPDINIQADGIGTSYLGGLFGKVSNLDNVAATMQGVTITTNSNNLYAGGLAGQATNVTFDADNGLTMGAVTISNSSSNITRMLAGGVVGQGKEVKVKNLSLSSAATITHPDGTAANIGGIAGELTNESVISSVTVSTLDYKGTNVGGIAGKMDNATLTNVSVSSPTCTGTNAGGIAGTMTNATLTNSQSYAITSANCTGKQAGAVAGTITGGKVEYVTVTGANITVNYDGSTATGGLLASTITDNATLDNVSVEGTLNAEVLAEDSEITPTHIFGSLAGKITGGSILNCNNISQNITLTQAGYAGGLAGQMSGVTISDVTYSGAVTTDAEANFTGKTIYLGGLAGYMTGKMEIKATHVTNSEAVTTASTATFTDTKIYLGGFAGTADGGSVNDSSVSASVTANAKAIYQIDEPTAGGTGTPAGASLGEPTTPATGESKYPSLVYVGGLFGQASGVNVGATKSVTIGSVTENTTYDPGVAVKDNIDIAVGGVAGKGDNLNIQNTTVGVVTGTKIAGGFVGDATDVIVTGTLSTAQQPATGNPPAQGGTQTLTGTAVSVNVSVGSAAKVATTYAGGVFGKMRGGTIENLTLGGSISCATENTVSETGETGETGETTTRAPTITQVYAGGAVGHLSGGEIRNVTNGATVTAGWKKAVDNPLNMFDFYYHGPNSDDDDEGHQDWSNEVLQDAVKRVNDQKSGAEKTYAGGIFGYNANSSAELKLKYLTNNARITANAKSTIEITTKDRYSPWLSSYDAYAHHATQTTNAYAIGIGYMERIPEYDEENFDTTNFDIDTFTNTGEVLGGGVVKFNMFTEDSGDLNNYYRTYILDYKRDENRFVTPIFNKLYSQDSSNQRKDDEAAWIDAWNKGLKLEGVNSKPGEQKEKYGDDALRDEDKGRTKLYTYLEDLNYAPADPNVNPILLHYMLKEGQSNPSGAGILINDELLYDEKAVIDGDIRYFYTASNRYEGKEIININRVYSKIYKVLDKEPTEEDPNTYYHYYYYTRGADGKTSPYPYIEDVVSNTGSTSMTETEFEATRLSNENIQYSYDFQEYYCITAQNLHYVVEDQWQWQTFGDGATEIGTKFYEYSKINDTEFETKIAFTSLSNISLPTIALGSTAPIKVVSEVADLNGIGHEKKTGAAADASRIAENHNIFWHANGGTFSDETSEYSVNASDIDSWVLEWLSNGGSGMGPDNPTNFPYVFNGWSLTEGGDPVDYHSYESDPFRTRVDFYACWTEH